jgi:FkbH-like protein
MQRRDYLPETALENLGTLLSKISDAEAVDTDWAGDASIHFLRNYTTEPIDPYLQFHLIRDDIRALISHGGYGNVTQELLESNSILSDKGPDVIVLSLLVEFIDPRCKDPNWNADDALQQIDDLMLLLMSRTSLVIINTILLPIEALVNPVELDTLNAQITRVNEHLRHLQKSNLNRIYIIDFQEIYSRYGHKKSIDQRFWKTSQAPFRKLFLNAYAKEIAYYIRVLKGRAKKCLILDCDNTIWGGVVGEDGLEGIELHDKKSPGIHYYNLQNAAIDLQNQGVMLALCSKNNEEDVLNVLDNHPLCALQRSHLVGWRINWRNKAENLMSLAEQLNIGLDSIVFLDDSPHEQALVNELLPQVLVLPVPHELDGYANLLCEDRLFDTSLQSDEDHRRTRMYQDEAQRVQQQHRVEDLTEFLRSLQTVMRIAKGNDLSKTRIGQLTRKTNQFNLTTRRYTEADIESLIGAEDSVVYAMSVRDRYGDMGITGVFIARLSGAVATIDTFLLSCRVLGRQLEFAFAYECLTLLDKQWPGVIWHADFEPTRKNTQVADFWEQVGFTTETDSCENKHYILKCISRFTEYSNIITTELE